ncbi:MAG: hypothetical protein GY928_21210 [Colwellia sp.]|nr:hypothetical protein [Colwellia sp.]
MMNGLFVLLTFLSLIFMIIALGFFLYFMVIEKLIIAVSNYIYDRKKMKWKDSIIKKHEGFKVHFNATLVFIDIKNANGSSIEVKMGRGCVHELIRCDLWHESIKYIISIEENLLLIGNKAYRYMGDYWIEKHLS